MVDLTIAGFIRRIELEAESAGADGSGTPSPIAALTFLPNDHPGNARRSFSTPKRVRRPRPKPD
jgi:hypothetical protein